jgi:hypothetical protein
MDGTAYRIDIALVSPQHYRISYRGRTLIESTREPLFDACRALVAMGHAGRLEMWGSEVCPRMIVHDIERGAALMITSGALKRPLLRESLRDPNSWNRTSSTQAVTSSDVTILARFG